jgi:endonuclease/exonuclease/phosphatase family metal-dependent hydrolase
MIKLTRLFLLAGVTLAAATLAAATAAPAESHRGHGGKVTVMTRNLFLGTDLQPLFAAPSLQALFGAVATGYAQMEATNFPERAQALAAEIAEERPDLVALQEATLFRTDTPSDGPATPAENVTYDFLQILHDALEDRGSPYALVDTLTGTDAELPAGFPPTRDVRLTDRIAVLARTGPPHKLTLSNVKTGTFAAKLVVPTAAGPLTLPRGWISVDAAHRKGGRFRLVATHLEAFNPGVQVAQGAELLAGPTATTLPVVLTGDLNSRADGPGTPTYANMLAGGFTDAWSAVGKGPGLTCCFAPSLLGPPALDKRIDLVLARGVTPVRVEVVGDEQDDRTPSGLLPSDHAGVVAKLRLH